MGTSALKYSKIGLSQRCCTTERVLTTRRVDFPIFSINWWFIFCTSSLRHFLKKKKEEKIISFQMLEKFHAKSRYEQIQAIKKKETVVGSRIFPAACSFHAHSNSCKYKCEHRDADFLPGKWWTCLPTYYDRA